MMSPSKTKITKKKQIISVLQWFSKYFWLFKPHNLRYNYSAIVAIYKRMTVSVFQQNFTYKNSVWDRFGPLAILYQLLN